MDRPRAKVRSKGIEKADENIETPGSLELIQNRPNPFNKTTEVRFFNPIDSESVLSVYNVAGEQIFSHKSAHQKGWQTVAVDMTSISASGILFYEVNNGSEIVRKKMIMMR